MRRGLLCTPDLFIYIHPFSWINLRSLLNRETIAVLIILIYMLIFIFTHKQSKVQMLTAFMKFSFYNKGRIKNFKRQIKA